MNTHLAADRGVSLRQAALVAGFGLLIMVVMGLFAEGYVYVRLVTPGDIESTIENIRGNGLFLAAIFALLVLFIMDLVVAWALYVLLAPVNRDLSLLTAWFRILYTALAMMAMLKSVTVYRLLDSAEDAALFSAEGLQAHVNFQLDAYRQEWSFSLIIFGIYLILLGLLVYRSGYIPRILGVLLGLAGLAWVVSELGPFLMPGTDLGFLMILFAGELVFMAWLLFRGLNPGWWRQKSAV